MSDELFREGGPLNIKKTGSSQYSMKIPLPESEDGRTARECPNEECSPGYFKVKGGTGITEGLEFAFCPYCKNQATPNDFVTKDQLRYAQDLAFGEAQEGIERMIGEALGLGASGKNKIGGGFLSIEMSFKPGSKPIVNRPFEEEVRRDVVCPFCGLDQSVYGLATWCADCGKDIFLTHVEAELAVTRSMLNDVAGRRERLGVRIAAKDLENCLEDAVSVFEAVLRAFVRRFKSQNGVSTDDIDKFLGRVGNVFQNIKRSQEIFSAEVGMPLFFETSVGGIELLSQAFQKRHSITHNLGVIDKKYMQQARSAEKEGQEVLISEREIREVIELSKQVFASLHRRMFEKG